MGNMTTPLELAEAYLDTDTAGKNLLIYTIFNKFTIEEKDEFARLLGERKLAERKSLP